MSFGLLLAVGTPRGYTPAPERPLRGGMLCECVCHYGGCRFGNGRRNACKPIKSGPLSLNNNQLILTTFYHYFAISLRAIFLAS